MTEIQFHREWAMPNSETFRIQPINSLLRRVITKGVWVDPYVRNSCFKHLMKFTNDINPEFEADFHHDSNHFLSLFEDESVDGVLFDPPYSSRQIKECYDGIGRVVTQEDTQNPWSEIKKQIARICKPNAIVMRCGWNSMGIGKTLGFDMLEILLVPHGGVRNDTIVTVEKKRAEIQGVFDFV